MKVKKIFALEKFKDAMNISSSVITILVMVFSMMALLNALGGDPFTLKVYLLLSFLFLSISMLPLAIKGKKAENSNLLFIKYLSFGITYLTLGILSITLPFAPVAFGCICLFYLVTVVVNRASRIFEVKRSFSKIFNGLLALAALTLVVICSFAINEVEYISVVLLSSLMMFLVALVGVLSYAFSKIRLHAMIRIIRRTYVLEVLYGLVVLMVSFSFILYIFEGIFPTYGDALWYCFAVITTIGFGDFVAVSLLGRILTVILGIYGIIVVALITSVIVNFYNEVKNKGEPKELEKIKEEKEEETSKKKGKTK